MRWRATWASRARSSRACASSSPSWRPRKPGPWPDMAIKVRIPLTLRRLTGEQEVIELKAATVADAVNAMHARYNGIRERIVDPTGRIRGSVLVFVNEEDIRFL